jgi:hypothetical protein
MAASSAQHSLALSHFIYPYEVNISSCIRVSHDQCVNAKVLKLSTNGISFYFGQRIGWMYIIASDFDPGLEVRS